MHPSGQRLALLVKVGREIRLSPPDRAAEQLPVLQKPVGQVSSIVAAELAAGARTDKARRLLDDALLAPFERRGRILAPSSAAWRRSGAVLARTGTGGVSASRQNDVLLATQAREHGWAVVTRDSDLRMLRTQVVGLQVVAPFPERP